MRKQESNDTYHSEREHISSTSLKHYDKSPLHYRYAMDNPESHEAMGVLDFGCAVHTMVFEPELFETAVLVMDLNDKPEPDKTFASKANKEWKANWLNSAKVSGLPLIDNEQRDTIVAMKAALMADPFISKHLLDGTGVAERSYYVDYKIPGTDTVVKIKARPDWETDSAIFDYKSVKDASYYGFLKAISQYLWHMSAAMYREVVATETGLLKPFIWIAQEKEPPYACALYIASSEDIRKGLQKMLQLLTNHAICTSEKFWPGYTSFGNMDPGFAFMGAKVSTIKWDNEALSLASAEIPDELIEVRKNIE